MTKLLISLLIGVIAGIIDIIPMIIQKLDRFAIISAFVHWVVLGVLIAYLDFSMPPWLKGVIVAELSALPILVLVWKDDPKSIIPIVIMSAILGILVGLSTTKFC
jgi:hydrogenase/urease accessory protein HupE